MARRDLRPGLFALPRPHLWSSMLCDATPCHQPVPCLATTIEACLRCAFLHLQYPHTPSPLYIAFLYRILAPPALLPLLPQLHA